MIITPEILREHGFFSLSGDDTMFYYYGNYDYSYNIITSELISLDEHNPTPNQMKIMKIKNLYDLTSTIAVLNSIMDVIESLKDKPFLPEERNGVWNHPRPEFRIPVDLNPICPTLEL